MLIIDSGIGGLSVLNNIKKELPNIHYIYMLDNEAFPYGKKRDNFIIKRMIKIINIIKKNYPIKIVILGCNTASTISLSILRKFFNIPIIGVLPTLNTAIKTTKNKIIGLIATEGTINSTYIKKMIYQSSFRYNIKIIATNELAKIAEKKIRKLSISNAKLKKIFNPWILLPIPPDTIILGCTHFSFLKIEIKKNFYNQINFIDPGEIITNELKKTFCSEKIKKNILLCSKYNKKIKQLLFFLKKYEFKKIQEINLN
ncbi:glutamate racemase [Buchnera aphidicola]|uniref:glutamate racemase n=1 Tax=Buchnera aphidicola TaxID=9 RepID=UPI003464D329